VVSTVGFTFGSHPTGRPVSAAGHYKTVAYNSHYIIIIVANYAGRSIVAITIFRDRTLQCQRVPTIVRLLKTRQFRPRGKNIVGKKNPADPRLWVVFKFFNIIDSFYRPYKRYRSAFSARTVWVHGVGFDGFFSYKHRRIYYDSVHFARSPVCRGNPSELSRSPPE